MLDTKIFNIYSIFTDIILSLFCIWIFVSTFLGYELPTNISVVIGVILVALYLLKLIAFIISYYFPSLRVNISGCNKNEGNTLCNVKNGTDGKVCDPTTCGSYEEYSRYYNISSYDKYLKYSDSTDRPNGTEKDYDTVRLFTYEGITIAFLLLSIARLSTLEYIGIPYIIFGILFLVIVGLTIFIQIWHKKFDMKISSITFICLLQTIFNLSEEPEIICYVSFLLVFPFVILPLFEYHQDYCQNRTQNACVNDEADESSPTCKWDKINKICQEYSRNDSGNNSGNNSGNDSGRSNESLPICSNHRDEGSCNDNGCYYVKLNVDRNKLSRDGLEKINSKVGCIPENDKCNQYSCNSEFYPLNIFDHCCNTELNDNGCDENERSVHLDSVKDNLDETKGDDSEIKTLYGDEAWSKKVDFDESYRYCESKNRRSEMDAGIYA